MPADTGGFSNVDIINAVMGAQQSAASRIQEEFAKRREELIARINEIGQKLQMAQLQCSQGNQSACQMIGQLNSEDQRLKADLDRLGGEESKALSELEQGQNAGPSVDRYDQGNPYGMYNQQNPYGGA